jgi:hypothetical protein
MCVVLFQAQATAQATACLNKWYRPIFMFFIASTSTLLVATHSVGTGVLDVVDGLHIAACLWAHSLYRHCMNGEHARLVRSKVFQ